MYVDAAAAALPAPVTSAQLSTARTRPATRAVVTSSERPCIMPFDGACAPTKTLPSRTGGEAIIAGRHRRYPLQHLKTSQRDRVGTGCAGVPGKPVSRYG